MAKIKQGILGGFSGKIANVVGTSWKGLAVMKAKPLSVANPRTVKQTNQRTKFKTASKMSALLRVFVMIPFWNHLAQYMSGANLWMQKNLQFFNSDGTCSPAALIFSQGSIGNQAGLACAYNPITHTFAVEWVGGTLPTNGLATDEIGIIIVNSNSTLCAGLDLGTVVRSDNEVVMPLFDNEIIVGEYAVHLIAKSADKARQSGDTSLLVQLVN